MAVPCCCSLSIFAVCLFFTASAPRLAPASQNGGSQLSTLPRRTAVALISLEFVPIELSRSAQDALRYAAGSTGRDAHPAMAIVASAAKIGTAQDHLMELAFPYPIDAVSARDIICAAQSGRYMVACACAVAVSHGSGQIHARPLSEVRPDHERQRILARDSAAAGANGEPRRRPACVAAKQRKSVGWPIPVTGWSSPRRAVSPSPNQIMPGAVLSSGWRQNVAYVAFKLAFHEPC